jgi:hypothetical protein
VPAATARRVLDDAEPLFCTTEGLFTIFGLPGRSVKRYIADLDFPCVRVGPRKLLYDVQKVRAWIEAQGKRPLTLFVPDPADRTAGKPARRARKNGGRA